ncbi:MAG: hypothetical protein JWL64_2792 [Frankiales bacterium]|nr:hypothetical protein [Frankiales bacterium]
MTGSDLDDAVQDLTVADVMSSSVLTVDESDSLVAAATLMQRAGIRHVPVLRGDRPVGVLNDILAAARLSTLSWSSLCEPVEKTMVQAVARVHPGTSLSAAARQLGFSPSGALLVVEGDALVGVLTAVDLVRAVAGSDPGASYY